MLSSIFNGYRVHLVQSLDELERIKLKLLNPKIQVGIDSETTGLDFDKCEAVGYCISCGQSYSTKDYHGFYIPIRHRDSEVNLPVDKVVEFLQFLMDNYKTIFFNRNFDFHFMEKDGVKINPKQQWHDAQAMAFLATQEGMPSLKKYAERFLKWDTIHYEDNNAEDGSFGNTDPRVSYIYAAGDPVMTCMLGRKLWTEFPEIHNVYTNIDNYALEAFRYFTTKSIIPIDYDKIEDELRKVQSELSALKAKIFAITGYEFRLTAAADKIDALSRFVTLTQKTASGKFDSSVDALSRIDHPLAKLMVEFSHKETYRHSYVDKLASFKKPYPDGIRINYFLNKVPCLTASAKVCIKGRGIISIADVGVGDYIWTHWGWKKVVWNNKHWCDEIFEISTIQGTRIKCSPNHLFLKNEGTNKDLKPAWYQAQALYGSVLMNSHTVSDYSNEVKLPEYVCHGQKVHITLPTHVTPELARLMGMFDGDGSIVNDGVKLCFSAFEPELEDYYCSIVESIFGVRRPARQVGKDNTIQYKYSSVDLRDYFKLLNLRQKNYDGVSEYIMKSTPEVWKAYIQGFWDADGSMVPSDSRGKKYGARACTMHKGLMTDIKTIMDFLGMHASLYVKGKADKNPRYEVAVRGARGHNVFKDLIGQYLKCDHKRERCLSSVFKDKFNANYDKVDISLPTGEADWVYDIEVEDVHEYVANGFVTHNTGRTASGSSSGNPFYAPLNIQSIPKTEIFKFVHFDDLLGYRIDMDPENAIGKMKVKGGLRDAFTAPEGYVFLNADFAAEELRVMANLSGEPHFINPILEGKDLHTYVAKQMFGFEDKSHRTKVKILNFSIAYGANEYTIAERLGIPVPEAKELYDNYFKTLKKFDAWRKNVIAEARRKKIVFTAFGRPRNLFSLYNSSDPKQRAFADRTALNSPVQGFGGDLIRICHIKLWQRFLTDPEFAANCRYHSTVHDEISLLVKPNYIYQAYNILKDIMFFQPKQFRVPIVTEPAIGYSWGTLCEAERMTENGHIILNRGKCDPLDGVSQEDFDKMIDDWESRLGY